MAKKTKYSDDDYATQPEVATEEVQPVESCEYEVLEDETAIDGVLYNKGDKVTLAKEQGELLQSRGVCLSATKQD